MGMGAVLGRKQGALWLAVAMLLTFAAALPSGAYIQPPAGQSGAGDTLPVNAAVVIKTQQAANQAVTNGAIRGIDVSQYQGNINWSSVAKDNVKFAMIRASYGLQSDTHFYKNAQDAAANGVAVGAYHYAKYTDRASMLKEASFFISMLKNVKITYPVALDVEAHRGLSPNAVADLAVEFMELVRAQGYNVLFYSYSNFLKESISTSRLGSYRLWVANYQEQPNHIEHVMWQHTSYGAVSGIAGRVDINIAYKSLAPQAAAIKVDPEVSAAIKSTLNERYNVGLPLNGLDMKQMTQAIMTGLQTELNAQLGSSIAITGTCDRDTVNAVSSINFVLGETGGNITYLLQCKLFYKGLYATTLTGTFDEHTSEAVEKYQRSQSILATGYPDYETLRTLLYA